VSSVQARNPAYTLAMVSLALAEAKDKLSAVVNDVTSTHEHYMITRNGRSVAVVLPVGDLESLEETVFWLERDRPAALASRALTALTSAARRWRRSWIAAAGRPGSRE
jgi:prevent-host-death family protein